MAQHTSQTSQESADIPAQPQQSGTVTPIERGSSPRAVRPIPGMKTGWYYRPHDRAILHQPKAEGPVHEIGTVPRVTGRVVHLTDDGQDVRQEYQIVARRQRRKRIITEDELDKGSWAAKVGVRRPTGNDERHAYARVIRELGDEAPEVPARTYYADNGDLVLPDADAQQYGYRTLRGTEADAQAAWEEIGRWAVDDPSSALVLGAAFAGPVLDAIDVLAHAVNMHGPGQQGKSTALTCCAALYGDIKPRRQQLLMTWNSSKQGITQSLRQRGYLPMYLDEHSSSGRTPRESSSEISQMVSGAIRLMGAADGSPREVDGFWHSVLFSSSNDPLKYTGQTEDLASRLQEIRAPFFANVMLDREGRAIEEQAGEHLSKRLKRLAKNHGGWPLEWAVKMGMFTASSLDGLQQMHLELCSRHRPAGGGIPATIAELHMAWVVGAHMLGAVVDVPQLGPAAERAAAQRLEQAVAAAAEANLPDGERLWQALDAMRLDAASFPFIHDLTMRASEGGANRPRGFHRGSEWWVTDPVVRAAAADAGVDNLTAALRQLSERGVHLRGDGAHAQRLLPREVRKAGLGSRMHCFELTVAEQLFAAENEDDSNSLTCGGTTGTTPGVTGTTPDALGTSPDLLELWERHLEVEKQQVSKTPKEGAREVATVVPGGSEQFPDRNHLEPPPGTTPVVPENPSLTCDGTTGTTGTTISPEESRTREEAPAYPSPSPHLTDSAFAGLVSRAQGRTAAAVRIGVLGDGRLFLPNHRPVKVAVPGSVDELPALMDAYELRTLWVHADGAHALGLPTYEERLELPPVDGGERRPGPQTPVRHPWVARGDGSPISRMAPEGLSSWLTLIVPEGEGERRLNVSLPLYDDRIDRSGQPGRGGFGAAESPAVLLDALMLWLTSTVHGRRENPQVISYYQSPNKTGEDAAGGRGRTDVTCEAIRAGEVPPALGNATPLLVRQRWHRSLSAEERDGGGWVHEYDKTAAWLAAYGSTRLGIGEPVHDVDGDAPFTPQVPGYWRVVDVPSAPEGMPEFRVKPGDDGSVWLRTPEVTLLTEIDPTWTPRVLESWYWPQHKRALEGMYKLLSTSRRAIVTAAEQGRPGAKAAKQVNGRVYQSFRGHLARAAGPQRDRTNGGAYAGDIYYRPDWAQMMMSAATCNQYRNLLQFRAADGRAPLSVNVDAVAYVSEQSDPEAGRPEGMRLGTGGGMWSVEHSAPLAELLSDLDDGAHPHNALNTRKGRD